MAPDQITEPQRREDFRIGIVCTLDVEAQAIDKLFDKEYNAAQFGRVRGDDNHYQVGAIGRHNVVLVKLCGAGSKYSATSVTDFRHSYSEIEVFLLVGICAGAPFRGQDRKVETETILGDVIIGDSIVQTDYGKQYAEGFERRASGRQVLGNPPRKIQNMLDFLRVKRESLHAQMMLHLLSIQQKDHDKWQYQGVTNDRLFEASIRHKHYGRDIQCECANCKTNDDPVCRVALRDQCNLTGCSNCPTIRRARLTTDTNDDRFIPRPLIHFGTIASSNTVMKSGEHRDKIIQSEQDRYEETIIAFEMEGAGMWENRACVIIKGVSDYADSHKNDIWHPYAAATAAACMRAFLDQWIPDDPLAPLSQFQQQARQNTLPQGETHEMRSHKCPVPMSRHYEELLMSLC